MGEYAPYARAILRGHLPESFAFRGPGYHLLLALVGLIVRDLFWAGKLLSVAAFGLLVGLTAWVARRTYGGLGASIAALLLVAQPLVLAHGWSVGTDMPFAALSLLALGLLLPRGDADSGESVPSSGRLAAAGAVAGYAWLTRPNGLFLVPAMLTALWLLCPSGRRRRFLWRAGGIVAVSFFAPTLLWMAVYHAVQGHWPVTQNYRNLAAAASPERGVMNPDVFRRTFETDVPGYGALVRTRIPILLWRGICNAPTYLGRMAWDLFGPIVSATALAGATMLIWWDRGSRRSGPARADESAVDPTRSSDAVHPQIRELPAQPPDRTLWVLPLAGVWAFLILAPLYYEPRFGLFLAAPVAFLGTALAFRPFSSPGTRLSMLVPPTGRRRVLLVVGIVLVAGAGLYQEIRLARSLRVLERSAVPAYLAAEALSRQGRDSGGVCARKPHVAFLADRPLIGFPDAPLELLTDSLRARGAAYLFYGVVEFELVSRYADLLRPEMIPPGLRLIHMSGGIPFGLLFRVEPSGAPQPLPPQFRAALDQIRGDLEESGSWGQVQERRAVDAFQEASYLISRRRYREAVPLLQTIVTRDSALAKPHCQLGIALVETGRAAEGLLSLQKARGLGFESAELWLYTGRAQQTLGNLPQARHALRRALELESRFGPATFFLGLVEAEAGRYDEAERLLARSLTEGVAEDEGFLDGRARVLIMAGKLKAADSLLAVARSRYPNSANIRIMSEVTAVRLGRAEEARRDSESPAPANPRGR